MTPALPILRFPRHTIQAPNKLEHGLHKLHRPLLHTHWQHHLPSLPGATILTASNTPDGSEQGAVRGLHRIRLPVIVGVDSGEQIKQRIGDELEGELRVGGGGGVGQGPGRGVVRGGWGDSGE